MARNFLAGVADVSILVGNQLVATAQTLLDSSITVGSSSEDVRGGMGAKLLGKYFHTSTFDVNLTDVLFKLEYLAFQTGSTIQQIADIFTSETVTLVQDGGGTVSETPADYQTYGTIGWVTLPGADSYQTVTFTGTKFEVPGAKAGDVYCVKYLSTSNASKQITISSSFIPSEVTLVMEARLFKAGSSDAMNESSQAGTIQVVVPRFLFNGAQEISMTSTGVANSPIAGSALDNPSADCSNGGYYAIISETLFGANWYDNVVALAVDGGEVEITTGGKETLNVYAITKGQAPFKPPYTDLTFTSAAPGTATVDVSGVITGVSAGTTSVDIAITEKNTVVTTVNVTVA